MAVAKTKRSPERSLHKQRKSTYTEVGCKAQPPKVRSKEPCGHSVYLGPDVRQVAGDAGQRDDVDCCFNRSVEAEEQRHPQEVETELNGVQGCAVLQKWSGLFVWIPLCSDRSLILIIM